MRETKLLTLKLKREYNDEILKLEREYESIDLYKKTVKKKSKLLAQEIENIKGANTIKVPDIELD